MSRFTDPIESTRKARRKVAESVESALDPNKPIDAFFDGVKSVVEVQRTVTKKAVGTPAAFVRGAAENVGKLQERGKERVDEVVSGVMRRKPEESRGAVTEPQAAPDAPTEPQPEFAFVPELGQPQEPAEPQEPQEPQEQVQKAEKAEKAEKDDKPEKPAKADKPKKAEKPAKAEKKSKAVEPVEKPAADASGVSIAEAVAVMPEADAPAAASTEASKAPEVPEAFAAPKKRNYRLMNHNQLRKACERRGLDTEGTLDELRARLREADEAEGA